MTAEPYFAPGDWNAVCDRCGRRFKASQMRRTWQGYYVCQRDWEPRHPQDFVRARQEHIVPPWVRPPIEPFVYPGPPFWQTPALHLEPAQPQYQARGAAGAGVGVGPTDFPLGPPPVIYGGDPLFGNVLLLLAGPAGGGVTDDSSVNNYGLAVTGAVTLSSFKTLNGLTTYEKPFDGITDHYLGLTSSDAWVAGNLSSGEWCLETYYNPTIAGPSSNLICSFGQIQLGWVATGSVQAAAGNIAFSSYSLGTAAGVLAIDTWAHIALIRDNTTDPLFGQLHLFVDGVLQASSPTFIKTASMGGSGFGRVIGYNSGSPGGCYGGLRLTANTRRYLANAEGEPLSTFIPDPYPFKTN